MMRGTTRWAHRALALCAATSAATVLVGCDDFGQAQALNVQAETNAMRLAGRGGTDEALQKLQGVAGAEGDSPAVIQAQQSLGQVQLAKANAAASDLARLQAQAGQTLFQIGQLARQARTSVVLANNYRQLDPALATKQIADFAAKARGDANSATFPVESAQIPSLAVVQQNKSRLDGEVAKLQEGISAATQERDRLLAEAGRAAAIQGQTGEARATTVKQIADLRGKAAASSRQISDLSATLARAQADQAEQTALAEQLQAAVESMTAQGTALTQGWQQLNAKAGDQTKLAKDTVAGKEGQTVSALTTTLNTQLKEIDAKREEVQQVYNDAIASLSSAATKAGTRVQLLNTAKSNAAQAYEAPAWTSEASLVAVDRMNIDKAAAEKGLADLHASRARWLAGALATTEDVESVSEALSVPAAEPFNGDKLRGELGKTVDTANEAYGTVVATLEGVTLNSEDLAPLKPRKAMMRIVTLSDQADLADLAAANKVSPPVAGKATELRESMRAAAAEAREASVPLPGLPLSMGGVLPTTAPAEGATTEPATPATPPAEGATPPAEGATPPAEGATPPAEGATPPATPPAEGATPPAEGATPPADPATPPAEGATPPAEGATPAPAPETPPADRAPAP